MDGGRRPAAAGTDLGVYGAQLAQFAAARKLESLHEIRAVSALRPCLIDAAEAEERVCQRAALGNGHRAWLFAIDVFARLRRHHGKQRMPAVARSDEQSVDVLARPQLVLV